MNGKRHKALAADPSRFPGLAVVEDAHPLPLVLEAYQLDISKPARIGDQSILLMRKVIEVAGRHPDLDAVFIECPGSNWQSGTNTKAIRALVKYTHAVELAIAYLGLDIDVIEIDPNSWHGDMLGPSRSSESYKALAIEQCKVRTRLLVDGHPEIWTPATDNIADATLVAVYGLGLLRQGLKEYLRWREEQAKAKRERRKLRGEEEARQKAIYGQVFPAGRKRPARRR